MSRVLVLLFAVVSAFAQSQAINGSIRGRVTDAGGAGVPGAKVTVLNDETGFTRALSTDDDGYYVVPNLPLGTYTVTIQKEGFTTERHSGVVLTAGVEAVIEGQLKVGAVTTEIEVTGGAAVIEPSRVSTGRTITSAEIENLPLTSRNPYNFIIFQPGVSGHPNPELGIPRTLNMNGLLDRINYQMDGMVDTESDRYGLRLFPISNIYVREVETVSNSYAPEFGMTAGNIYNVITNSGTNTPHGQFYYIGRLTDLSARPMLLALSQPKPNLTLKDFAGNAGGALIKDKLFLFGGYEHLERGLPQPNTINPTDAANIGIPTNLLAVAPSVQHAQFANFRVDWNISSKHQFFFRYNYFRNEYPFNTAVGGKNAIDAASDFQDRAHVIGAQVLSTFSPTVLNELRFGWPYRNEKHVANPLTGAGPQINVSGVAIFNGSTGVGDRYQEKIPNMNDSLTIIRGRHTMKYGFGWQQMLDTQTADVFSQYNFASVATYLQAKSGANPLAYSTYSTVIGLPGAWYHSFFWNAFAQDSVQLRSNLLVIFGVRYDRFQGPQADPNAPFSYSRSFRTPSKDFAPRLGLAWTITPKTVVRASSGMFYEPVPTNLWYNTFINSGNPLAYSASIAASSPLAPLFPNVLALSPGVVPPSADITTVTPNFRNAYTINTSVQISRQITPNDALTVGYVNTGARELTYLRNLNLINPVSFLADGRPVFSSTQSAATRLDPRFNNITLQDVGAITNYNALIVNLTHRWSKGFSISGSYTWSHSISDAPDANSFEQNIFIEDTTSRLRDRGNSTVNRPSALTFSALLAPTIARGSKVWHWLANNNELAMLGNFSSGDQQNIVANKNLTNDAKVTAPRPLFIGRNTVRGPSIGQFDARYTRTFLAIKERIRPKFIAEVNNLFNRENITALNTTVPVDALGTPTLPTTFLPSSTVLEKRIVQFGVRVDW
jgi:hypothetical protein